MLDIILALTQVLDKSAKADLIARVGRLPKHAAWYVISDYVFEDPQKNDVASFVLLLHHDDLDVMQRYIAAVAPSDLKNVRSAPEGLLQYLNSPVAFSFSFVLQGAPGFLKDFATSADMIAQLDEFDGFLEKTAARRPGDNDYYVQARRRMRAFAQELRQKGNQKLARKVFLVAAYAVVVFECLDQAAEPAFVAWVSDRDAMLDRHDGVAFDIASLMFLRMKSERIVSTGGDGAVLIEQPRFVHVQQDKTGENYLDPLIRMADYVAGTVADMNLDTRGFSHPKFQEVAQACFVESRRHVIVTLALAGDGFDTRRVVLTSGDE